MIRSAFESWDDVLCENVEKTKNDITRNDITQNDMIMSKITILVKNGAQRGSPGFAAFAALGLLGPSRDAPWTPLARHLDLLSILHRFGDPFLWNFDGFGLLFWPSSVLVSLVSANYSFSKVLFQVASIRGVRRCRPATTIDFGSRFGTLSALGTLFFWSKWGGGALRFCFFVFQNAFGGPPLGAQRGQKGPPRVAQGPPKVAPRSPRDPKRRPRDPKI